MHDAVYLEVEGSILARVCYPMFTIRLSVTSYIKVPTLGAFVLAS